MKVFLRNDLRDVFVIIALSVFFIVLVVSFPSSTREEIAEEEVQMDETIPELEANIKGLEEEVSAKDTKIAHLKKANAPLYHPPS